MLITSLEQTVIPHNSLYLTEHKLYQKIVDYPTCAKRAFLMLITSLEQTVIPHNSLYLHSIHYKGKMLITQLVQKWQILMLITSLWHEMSTHTKKVRKNHIVGDNLA